MKAKIWVAVRVQRGFISDARTFKKEHDARRQETAWQSNMNPDYDEVDVFETILK